MCDCNASVNYRQSCMGICNYTKFRLIGKMGWIGRMKMKVNENSK